MSETSPYTPARFSDWQGGLINPRRKATGEVLVGMRG